MGKRFNSPNDLTIAPNGRVYFSDPRYVGKEPIELAGQHVYRIDTDGSVTAVVTDVKKPNGLAISPDGSTLYVAESNPGGDQLLLAYAIKPDGSVGPQRRLHDFGKKRGIDGMCCDTAGNIYGAAGSNEDGGVYVFSHNGKKVAFVPVPETPTNCVFAGKDRNVLYITAGKSLYRIRLNATGFAAFWPSEQ
jgi:gluconolactonase